MNVNEQLETLGTAWGEFKAANEDWRAKIDRDLDSLGQDLAAVQVKAGRPNVGTTTDAPSAQGASTTFIDTKSHKRIQVLRPQDRLAALERHADATPTVGRFLRGIVMGAAADDARELADERKALNLGTDTAGGFTVSGQLAANWIDLLRAEMVLTRAGATTVPMDSKTLTLAKLTADPTVSWHGENAAITDSDPTFGAVQLNARTIVGLVKMSVELSQDSANIEQILQRSLVSAIAGAIDSAGLSGTTTDAAVAPMGIYNAAGRNAISTVGAPTSWDFVVDAMYELMADNVPMDRIGAMIGHPAIWKKMRKLKSGIASDNTSLVMPAEVAALPKLWTTAAPFTSGTTCSAIIGDWSDLLFGIRQDITVRVLNEAFMGSNLQVAVLVYARCDFAAVRESSFCTMPGITI